jgi:hypothetical protein
MEIRKLFFDCGQKLGVPARLLKFLNVQDPAIIEVLEKAEFLFKKRGFQYSRRSQLAAQAMFSHIAATTGEMAFGGGLDLYKERDNGGISIIGFVCNLSALRDKKNPENHFVVQVDITANGNMLTPRYINYKDLLDQTKNQDIEAFFKTLPSRPLTAPQGQSHQPSQE